ncbi:unnamed protein product [Musa acuminata var. zebrina]
MPKFSRVLNNVKFGRSCGGADPLLLSPLGLPLFLSVLRSSSASAGYHCVSSQKVMCSTDMKF